MENYIQLHFTNIPSSDQELLIAQLADVGFDAFEQGDDFLKACVAESSYDESILNVIVDINKYSVSTEIIEQVNWNAEWEKSFQPVVVEDFCAIRASFHPHIEAVQHEIVITPKMSFGTGHHATTYQVIQLMHDINFIDKAVLDFGTGTGVLAILAEKLGAKEVLAIDNDEWSINNAKENIDTNRCLRIKLTKADHITSDQQFDVILANINKHVILENLTLITKQLLPGGVLIVSGILKNDLQDIVDAAFNENFLVKTQSEKHDWIALSLTNVNSI